MDTLTLKDLTFTYPAAPRPALSDISLTVAPGEWVLFIGASGSGKTTLLRKLSPALAPLGSCGGAVLLGDAPLDTLSKRDAAALFGYVGQNPDNGFVTDSVWSELSFAGENLGYEPSVLRRRVAEMASFFGISDLFSQEIETLSGGQKQLLNLAAAMVTDPGILILDEPTARLDPIEAENFFAALFKLNRELGITILMSEQRPEAVFPLVSRVAALENGRLLFTLPPREAAQTLLSQEHPLCGLLPPAARVTHAVGGEVTALTVREGRQFLAARFSAAEKPAVDVPEKEPAPAVITAKEIRFRYDRHAADILKGLDLSVYKGRITAVLGDNGCGKSTLLSLIAGVRKPQSGKLKISGKVGLLPQDPQTLFLHDTVRKELAQVSADADEIAEMAEKLGLSGLLSRHPYDLSGGEQQWAALAKVLLCRPDILLLDEPTKGLDSVGKSRLQALLRELSAHGVTTVFVSHDMAFCARAADICTLLFDGQVSASEEPHRFFCRNRFYTTAAFRLSRDCFENAVTTEEVSALCQSVPPRG